MAKVIRAKIQSVGDAIINILNKLPVVKILVKSLFDIIPNKGEALPRIVDFSWKTLKISPSSLLSFLC